MEAPETTVMNDVTSGADVTESRYDAILSDIESNESGMDRGAAKEEGEETTTTDEDKGKDEKPNYGDFNTLEELLADHKAKKAEVDEFTPLKGRLGQELGQAKAEVQRLAAALEAVRASANKPPVEKPDQSVELKAKITDLEKQYEDGTITMGQFIAARDDMIRASMKSEMESLVQQKIEGFKGETAKERAVKDFLDKNPGYIEAYNAGHLMEDLNKGIPGEWAWDRHQLKQAKSEIDTLNKKIADAEKQARDQGFKLGVKAEKGKEAAGKVLGGKAGTSFSQKGKTGWKDDNERLAAAVAHVARMKG